MSEPRIYWLGQDFIKTMPPIEEIVVHVKGHPEAKIINHNYQGDILYLLIEIKE